MKKILILMHHAESTYWFKRELIEKLIKSGCEVHVSVPDYQTIKERMPKGVIYHDTEINRRGINPLQDYKLYCEYKRMIAEIKPEGVYTVAIKPNIYGNIAAAKQKIPVISNVTGLGSTFQREKGLAFTLICLLYKKAFKQECKVVFENQGNAGKALKWGLLKPEQVIVSPGAGVNIVRFQPIEAEEGAENICFLLSARIMTEKGVGEFLQAANLLAPKYKDVKFRIIGMVEEELLLKEIQQNANVEYLGQLLDPRAEMSRAACIVLPSYHEGMANTLLEGAAMGKPLVATNINGCREAIEEGVTGYLCQPKDAKSLTTALEKIINLSTEERIQMGKKGREKIIREFNREDVVNIYIDEMDKHIIRNL